MVCHALLAMHPTSDMTYPPKSQPKDFPQKLFGSIGIQKMFAIFHPKIWGDDPTLQIEG
jgi:hypothetical protein